MNDKKRLFLLATKPIHHRNQFKNTSVMNSIMNQLGNTPWLRHFRLWAWLLLYFVGVAAAQAQGIIVQSFQLDETDLTANTSGTMVYDQNGDKCALIKVETLQRGFTFDGGMLGVAKVEENHNGEIWVYVPDRLSHLTISHPQLGILRNHDLGMSVQKGRTYILKLTTGTVQTVVQQTVMSQYLVFQVTPADAMVLVNNEAWPVSEGSALKFVAFGNYDYRVSSKLYHPEVGRVEVKDPNNKVVVNVQLKPAFGHIAVPATGDLAGATIYIDNEMVGQTPVTSAALASGPHTVMAVKPLYQSKEQTVTVTDGQTLTVQPTMSADFATVTLTVDNNAEIYVNGERKGAGSWSGNLASGEYVMETRLANHRASTTTKRISPEQRTQTFHLDAPIPIYGSLNVATTPAMADVYIDNQLAGQTPLFLQQYLVGNHSVRVSKANYGDYQTSVTIQEGRTAEVGGALSNLANVSLSCNASNAQIVVDGQAKGLLSNITQLGYGHHEITLKAEGYNDYSGSIEVSQTQRSFNFAMVAKEGEKQTFTVKGVSFVMIPVKGGTFQMGATSEQKNPWDDEKPVHSVTLSNYSIGETEVTQALWQAVMGSNPAKFKGPNRPVEQVSWNDCQTFIQKLNALTGKKFRLPTEAEWEYAARGGSKSRGYQYAGSKDLGSVAWYSNNSGSTTHDVKTKAPNELGLYDMSGNVWEWCQDWKGSYSSSAVTNPQGPASGSNRVNRGGSWYNSGRNCRSATRLSSTPSGLFNFLGLRLVL
jgi:formylglycine-generating enzyme required for sulfatase activity